MHPLFENQTCRKCERLVKRITARLKRRFEKPYRPASAVLCATLALPLMAQAQTQVLYLGTYSGPQSQGIYRCTLNETSGQLSVPELVAEAKNPSFVAISPNHHTLYAVGDSNEGTVGAWSIASNGRLAALNQQPSGGSSTCHLSVDATGKNVLVASYGSGTIAVFPVRPDGSLGQRSAFVQNTGSGPNVQRQEKAHAHSIYVDPSNRFVYSCDLSTDHIDIYAFDSERGKLEPANPPFAKVPAGAGPRHLAFDKAGHVFVVNEMGLSVTAFSINKESGALTEIHTVPTLEKDTATNGVSTAEIFVHPSGRWLYASNRGRDTITVFGIDANGKLSRVEETVTPQEPRGFGLSADGKWLVVGGQKDNQLAAFKIDSASGKLTASGHPVSVGSPVCVVFAPPYQSPG